VDVYKIWAGLALIFLLMVASWVLAEFIKGIFKKGGEKDGEDQ
jgi:hypothetical protein